MVGLKLKLILTGFGIITIGHSAAIHEPGQNIILVHII